MSDVDLAARAIAFLELAFTRGEPRLAVSRYVGTTYRQHSPGLGGGAEAFIAFVERLRAQHPNIMFTFHRTIVERDFVAIHTEVTGLADSAAAKAAVDIYRFDDNARIVEHWEVIQDVPAEARNENGMF